MPIYICYCDKSKNWITCTETGTIPFKFLVTNVMYIFVNFWSKKQIQSPTQSTTWMIRKNCDNFKVKLRLYSVYMKLAPLQAKAPLKWPRIHHCNTQSNVHHLELHGIESRVVFPQTNLWSWKGTTLSS